MSAPAARLIADELCAAVTDAMLAFHQRYYHREPVTANTSLLGDDLVACVLGGVYTDVEIGRLILTPTETPHCGTAQDAA